MADRACPDCGQTHPKRPERAQDEMGQECWACTADVGACVCVADCGSLVCTGGVVPLGLHP